MACGDGIRNIEILQMGVKIMANDQRFFYPAMPHNTRLPSQLLATFGYCTRSRQWVDTKTRRTEPLRSQKEAVAALLKNLRYAANRGRYPHDGVVLVVLHIESLLALIRCIVATEDSSLEEDLLDTVKGFCILEPIVRTRCLSNCPDGTPRIDQALAARLFGCHLEANATAEDMAVNTARMAQALLDQGLLSCQFFGHAQAGISILERFSHPLQGA